MCLAFVVLFIILLSSSSPKYVQVQVIINVLVSWFIKLEDMRHNLLLSKSVKLQNHWNRTNNTQWMVIIVCITLCQNEKSLSLTRRKMVDTKTNLKCLQMSLCRLTSNATTCIQISSFQDNNWFQNNTFISILFYMNTTNVPIN